MPGILIKNVAYEGTVGDFVIPAKRVGFVQVGDYDQVVDGTGLTAVPAFHDHHVHFRDPGQTEKEDLLSGARAAAAGGYVSVECEPNTRPVIDTLEAIEEFEKRYAEMGIPIRLYTKCALTYGQRGEKLVNIRKIDRNVFSFSSDGEPVVDRELLVKAFRLIHAPEVGLSLHCEETPHSSARLREVLGDGPAYAREPELIRLALSALAEAKKGYLHIQHVSLAESAELIAKAKADHVCVSAEVAPHHLLLCEDDIPLRNGKHDANWKMNPPLRSRSDMLALRKALADGTIDYIATDHAPHTPAEKARPWDEAPFGVIGLETAFGACMNLVHSGEVPLERLIWAFAHNRATGNVNLVDLSHKWTVDPDKFYSKGRNCPFAGMTFTGKVMYTIANGKLVMADGEVLF